VNDKEVLKEMLTRAKIPFEEKPAGKSGDETDIIVERGYPYFVTVFCFDAAGQLKDMGAFE